jgi:hypothetical protein
MGMFDYLYYDGKEYQTKDTPNQGMDKYKLEYDQVSGHLFLWLEEYDSEWIEDKEHPFGAYEKQSNHHWVHCSNFDGNIIFYRPLDKTYNNWEEISALIMEGKVIKLINLTNSTNRKEEVIKE